MVFSYTQMSMASLPLNPDPASVLIVGGGGTLPMALRDLLPNARIDTVEIDEAVVRVAREYFGYQGRFQSRHHSRRCLRQTVCFGV